ncbi:hypothetical protein Y032_0071g509 [Ancylostoma ceylanicum]|nr:hypothetical protein Y032_0071g509 [Ancylostoma ceylanicum]
MRRPPLHPSRQALEMEVTGKRLRGAPRKAMEGHPAIVCVTLLNRMKGDQVKIEHDQYIEFEERPFRLVTALIRKQLGC